MVIKEKKELDYHGGKYKEYRVEEGLFDHFIRLCEKLGVPPIIAVMNFIFMILLIFSILFVYANRDLYSTIVFAVTLSLFTVVNLYVYKKEREFSLKS